MIDIAKLIEGKTNLTELDIQILEYIVAHIDDALQMGVREIARENYTSPTTVVRLSKKLGYKGFIDMCYELKPLIKKIETAQRNAQNDFHETNKIDFFTYQTKEDIDAFIQNVLCLENKFIFIYATGFSAIAAEYIQKKLLVLGKKSILATAKDSIGVFESNLTDIGALIVISKSGETKKVVEKCKIAAEKGIYIVSFTKEAENTVAKMSDLNIKIYDDYKLDDRNMLPNNFFPRLLTVFEFLIKQYFELKVDSPTK